MKRLYNKDTDMTNKAGDRFSSQISSAVIPIIREWFESGYSVRDMQSIVVNIVVANMARFMLIGRKKDGRQ